jgi:hypothetical protein
VKIVAGEFESVWGRNKIKNVADRFGRVVDEARRDGNQVRSGREERRRSSSAGCPMERRSVGTQSILLRR